MQVFGPWKVASEARDSKVSVTKNEVDIRAPKGLTLWYKERMTGNTVIEYEAMIDTVGGGRLSDLNCFWMADGMGEGRFLDNYARKLYYMGYGGNSNTTTRFRRYTGDARGIDSAEYRPRILKEYNDAAHLLKANHWYSIRLEQIDGRVRYFIDGEKLVDYVDPMPLTSGYFGFRTTQAHARLRNFRYTTTNPDKEPVPLKYVGAAGNGPATFGVPFAMGEVQPSTSFTLSTDGTTALPYDTWTLAQWPDGSVKWQAFATVVPSDASVYSLLLYKGKAKDVIPSYKESKASKPAPSSPQLPPFYVTLNGKRQPVLNHEVERKGSINTVHKYTGRNFILRAYTYAGSSRIKLVHTLLVDSALNHDGLSEFSIHFRVPMHGEHYERFVAFDSGKRMSVQPLVARRRIDLAANDSITRSMVANIARWDGFRLSQLSPNGYSVRKRATGVSPWIGTMEGTRSLGIVSVGDSTAVTTFRLADFWQSYPSTLQVDDARTDSATVTLALYSPEAEPYSFEHYDTIAHTLEAAYEDVQQGLSTALGVARTSVIYIDQRTGGSIASAHQAAVADIASTSQIVPAPEYLYRKRAFGIWSLPTVTNPTDSLIESSLAGIMSFYKKEQERHGWYGFFNYGDFMHAYDAFRDEWRYDVGGYAWDNTELGTPAMLWYQFLRTGDADVWRMAEAMTRHCSEVDTYHSGPHAGLGSRHNVTHWGCGAKESRVSEAWWNRFYYYLTADERTGDIIQEVACADTILYHLDPMRLAQPRSLYPCTAPARLRLGPDWLGYASNWLAAWERGLGTPDKLYTGINSIARLHDGFFSGPLALGYNPATGEIINECDTTVRNTNHLMTIMGGFELMNEMEPMLRTLQPTLLVDKFYDSWLDHACRYKQMALKITRNKFLVPRLSAYAAWRMGDEKLRQQALGDLFGHMPLAPKPQFWTNDCATWTLDAIFMKEVLGF